MLMEEVKNSKPGLKKPKMNVRLFGAAMFLLGAFAFFALRFVTYRSDDVHYHANFALYVNGQKDEFKSFAFYEEVASCNAHDKDDVKGRVHLHDQNAGLVHIHADGVTWGQFFANLGYTLGNEVLATGSGTFVDGQDGKTLSFTLNGKAVRTIQDRVIKSTDRLLINYGNEEAAVLEERFRAVAQDADKANKTSDPSACSGQEEPALLQRLKGAAGFQAR